MQLRRCAVAWLEPREVASFQLDDLLAGGTGIVSRLAWFAHAPHLGSSVEVSARRSGSMIGASSANENSFMSVAPRRSSAKRSRASS